MGTISKSSAPLLMAGVLALLAGSAQADELIVMPYYCAVVGGEPVLSPSLDQGYRVLGPREQRTYTACSPVNPDRCRRWTLYRFDIDCGGVRVPWMSVAAAADRLRAPRTRRAWVENGHFYLPMPAYWTMAPDDPCRRWSDFDERWRARRFSSFCAERRESLGPPAVEMPAGFAPMLGIDAIFVPAPRGSEPPPPPASAYLGTPPPRIVRSEPPRPPPATPQEGAREPDVSAPSLKQEPAPQGGVKETPKNPPPKQQAAKLEPPQAPAARAAETPVPAPASSPPSRSPQPAAAASPPVVPRIINRSEPDSAEPAPAQQRADEPAPAATASNRASLQTAPEPSPPPPSSSRSERHSPASGAPPAATLPEERSGIPSGTISVSLVGGTPGPAAFAMAALAALAMLLTAAFAVIRWRERAATVSPRIRDIAAVSLDGAAGPRTSASARHRGEVALRPRTTAPQPASHQEGNLVPRWDDAMPRNRAEAFAILGMGVAPEADEVAIKKVVDGLRLSWHPDRATSPEDRAIRELRLKQINAAWELITGRRPEA